MILVTGSFSGSFDRKSRLYLNDGQTSTAMSVMGRNNVGGDFFFAKTDTFFLAKTKNVRQKKANMLFYCKLHNYVVHPLFISSFFSFLLACAACPAYPVDFL